MKYEIVYSEKFKKEIKKLDKNIANFIIKWINLNISIENPREKGKALKGNLKNYWRYRIANYRIICKILDDVLIIELLKIENRDKIYKR